MKKSPEKKGLIDSLKDKVSKKEIEKRNRRKKVFQPKTLKSEKKKLKNKMKKINK